MDIIKKSAIFFVPTILESVMNSQQVYGNMGKYGLYLGLYYKRNMLYVSIVSGVFLFNYMNNTYLLTSNMLFLFNYLYYIKVWNDYLL